MSDYPMLISNKLHSFRNFYIAKIRKKPRDVDALPHTLNKNYVFVFRFYAWKIGYFFIFVKVKTWCYGQVHQSFHRRGLQADFRSVRP